MKNIMKKFTKELFTCVIPATCIALLFMNFVAFPVKVHAFAKSEYKANDRLLVYRLDKKYEVDDMIQFKQNDISYIRRIVNIDNDTISVSDKDGNTSTININDIVGKVVYKF